MSRRLGVLWLLWLAGAAAGCGLSAEGGVTGTGISSVSGNVALVEQSVAALPFAIRVTLEQAPAIDAVTDADGAFVLRGRFAGAVTLRFSRVDGGDELGRLALEVPAGSTTLLENIAIDTGAPPEARVQPAAVRQLDVIGRLDLVECRAAGGALLVTAGDRQLLIDLTSATEILDRAGAALDCGALRAGQRVRVEGFLRLRTQTLVATQVVVAPPSGPAPDAPRRERFRGEVARVDCAAGELTVEQLAAGETVRRRVALVDATDLRCGAIDPRPCACAAIAPGDPVQVVGTILPRRPGLVVADALTVLPRLRAN